jgi:tRNA/tmRNA/rRNA uracil-C5-methylase (TrmA/RlmC/RlmD family)
LRVEPTGTAVSLLGHELELNVGAVAHGGHCVARVGDDAHGRVVFVRHTLPGERVRALVTEDAGGSFVRADAIEVLHAAPERVVAPCPHAGPGRCGGCDWQHVRPDAQRALKASVVREQFARLAAADVEVEVAELAGGPLHWRTRIGYTIDADGRAGLLRHRSRAVEPIESCPLGVAGVGDGSPLQRRWSGESRIEVIADDDGRVTVLAQGQPPPRRGRRHVRLASRLVDGPDEHHHVIRDADGAQVDFLVSPGSFWQVHPAAAQTYVTAVLRELRPLPGDRVLDLYAGAGLFTAALARAVGPTGRVVGVESDRQAVADAARNLIDLQWAQVQSARVTVELLAGLDIAPDLVILDPPRAGVGAAIMQALLDLGARVIAYVACDPASLARDVRAATDRGWVLRGVSAYDGFPMTHHIECIAVLTPN